MGEQIHTMSQSFTRPDNTTAYADGDLIANSATAGSVVLPKFNVGSGGTHLVRVALSKSGVGLTNDDFTLRFFLAEPTFSNGDNGAIVHDYAKHIFTMAIGAMVAGTDDAYVVKNLGELTGILNGGGLHLPQGDLYVALEANAAYAPAAEEVFTLELTFDDDSI